MRKAFTLALYFVFGLFACSEPEARHTQNGTEVEAEVRKALHNYYGDVAKDGLMAEFKYLDESDSFYWVPPGYSVALSYDTVRAIISRTAPMFKSINTTFDTLRVQLLGDSVAAYTAKLSSTMVDTSGKAGIYHLVESGVLIKRASGWKLLCGQTAMVN